MHGKRIEPKGSGVPVNVNKKVIQDLDSAVYPESCGPYVRLSAIASCWRHAGPY